MSRYFRLMGLATADILCTTPPAIFIMVLNATASPVGPWRSWKDTHFEYGRIEQIPAVLWRSNHYATTAIEFSRWVTPLCALVFFGFFGFAGEARKQYSIFFWRVVKPLGLRPAPPVSKAHIPTIGYACLFDLS